MTRIYFPDLQRHSFSRPTDWRWRRAQWLIANGRNFSPRRDDDATAKAIRYLRDIAIRRRRPREATLAKRHPEIWRALQLYESEAKARLMVEARILARQASPAIAELTGVPAAVIDAFEALFFSVREHIDARDWVFVHAIGAKRLRDEPISPAELAFKMFAYVGGPLVLERVAPYLVGGRDLFEPSLDLSTPQGRAEQCVRLAVAVQVLSRDPATDFRLQKVMLILRERQRKQRLCVEPMAFLSQNLDFQLREVLADASSTRVVRGRPTPVTPVAGALREAG